MSGVSVRADWNGGYAATVTARQHRLAVDEPAEYGGGDSGPMPTEYLAAAIASCFCLAVAHVAKKRGIELPGLAVTVDGERPGRELRYGRFVVTARAEVDADVLAPLVERAQPFCWVSNTLDAGVELEFVAGRD